MRPLPILAAALLAAGCAPLADRDSTPASPATPVTVPADNGGQPAARMAATAHPLASKAALDMLAQGGSPIDAAIGRTIDRP